MNRLIKFYFYYFYILLCREYIENSKEPKKLDQNPEKAIAYADAPEPQPQEKESCEEEVNSEKGTTPTTETNAFRATRILNAVKGVKPHLSVK